MPEQTGRGAADQRLRVKVTSGRATGEEILVGDELLIGRHADGPGRLGEDDEISREHARITCSPDGNYVIEDLGSTNGTFVNGRRIEHPELLSVGDTIVLGQSTLVVQFSGVSPAVEAPTEPVGEPASAPQAEVLALELEVDFERRQAQLRVGGPDEAPGLVYRDGSWHPHSTSGLS